MSWVQQSGKKSSVKQFALKCSFSQTPNGAVGGKEWEKSKIEYPYGFMPIQMRVHLERTSSSKHKRPLSLNPRLKVELLVSEQQMGSPGPAEELARPDSYEVSPANTTVPGETLYSLKINWHSAGSDDRSTYFKNSLHYKAVALCRIKVSAPDSNDITPFISNRFRVVKYKLRIDRHPPGIFFNAVGGKQKMTELKYSIESYTRNGITATSYEGLRLRPYLSYEFSEDKFMQELNTTQMFKCVNQYDGTTGTLKFRIGDVSLKHKKKLFVVTLMPDLEDVDHYQIAPAVSKPVRVVAKPLSRKVLFECIAGIDSTTWMENAENIAIALRKAHLRDPAMMRQGNDDILELQASSNRPAWTVTNTPTSDGSPAVRLTYACKLTKEEAYRLNPYNITAQKQSTSQTDNGDQPSWISDFESAFRRSGFHIRVMTEPKVWDPFRLRKIGMQDPSEPHALPIKNESGRTLPMKGANGYTSTAQLQQLYHTIQRALDPLVNAMHSMNQRMTRMEGSLQMLGSLPPPTPTDQMAVRQTNHYINRARMPMPGRLMARKRPSSSNSASASKRQRHSMGTTRPVSYQSHAMNSMGTTSIRIDVPTLLRQQMPPPPKAEETRASPAKPLKPNIRIQIPGTKGCDPIEDSSGNFVLTPPMNMGGVVQTLAAQSNLDGVVPPLGGGLNLKREDSGDCAPITPTMDIGNNGFHPAFQPMTPLTTTPVRVPQNIQNVSNVIPTLGDLPSLPVPDAPAEEDARQPQSPT